MTGVDQQIHHDLLNLTGVGHYRQSIRLAGQVDLNIFACPMKHIRHLCDNGICIQGFCVVSSTSRETQKLPREIRATVDQSLYVL